MDINWFNLHPRTFRPLGFCFKFYNAFHRKYIHGASGLEIHWGCGLLQINGRHLIYLGTVQGPPVQFYLFFRRLC